MYKDAMQLAIDSGFGQSEIVWGEEFHGMYDDIIQEDVPDISAALNVSDMEIIQPEHGLLDQGFDEIAPPTEVDSFSYPDMLEGDHVDKYSIPEVISKNPVLELPENHVQDFSGPSGKIPNIS